MTEFQLLYLRFLAAQRDFPELRHEGQGPTMGDESYMGYEDPVQEFDHWCSSAFEIDQLSQIAFATREFNRSIQPSIASTPEKTIRMLEAANAGLARQVQALQQQLDSTRQI